MCRMPVWILQWHQRNALRRVRGRKVHRKFGDSSRVRGLRRLPRRKLLGHLWVDNLPELRRRYLLWRVFNGLHTVRGRHALRPFENTG